MISVSRTVSPTTVFSRIGLSEVPASDGSIFMSKWSDPQQTAYASKIRLNVSKIDFYFYGEFILLNHKMLLQMQNIEFCGRQWRGVLILGKKNTCLFF